MGPWLGTLPGRECPREDGVVGFVICSALRNFGARDIHLSLVHPLQNTQASPAHHFPEELPVAAVRAVAIAGGPAEGWCGVQMILRKS